MGLLAVKRMLSEWDRSVTHQSVLGFAMELAPGLVCPSCEDAFLPLPSPCAPMLGSCGHSVCADCVRTIALASSSLSSPSISCPVCHSPFGEGVYNASFVALIDALSAAAGEEHGPAGNSRRLALYKRCRVNFPISVNASIIFKCSIWPLVLFALGDHPWVFCGAARARDERVLQNLVTPILSMTL